eukprot:CAMPEP_0174253324 /NCGR_PEP_ID=MMETSP0439-20130205/2696_1 /TAXON_ID=0 /ORGANISM="Stereomyxa ramosa, Strain Chinc5" /LENGTH=523 /DNA_ID=CAMNT_0015334289 /DNA_START=49 /DNA_END=1620 /DNA_ORIENTATION=-
MEELDSLDALEAMISALDVVDEDSDVITHPPPPSLSPSFTDPFDLLAQQIEDLPLEQKRKQTLVNDGNGYPSIIIDVDDSITDEGLFDLSQALEAGPQHSSVALPGGQRIDFGEYDFGQNFEELDWEGGLQDNDSLNNLDFTYDSLMSQLDSSLVDTGTDTPPPMGVPKEFFEPQQPDLTPQINGMMQDLDNSIISPSRPHTATQTGGGGFDASIGRGTPEEQQQQIKERQQQYRKDQDDEEFTDRDDDVLQYVFAQSATQEFKLPQEEFEWELYNEIITCRQDPKFYAKILYSHYRPYYQGNVLRLPGLRAMMTREGVAACEDAIRYLATVEPVKTELLRNIGLCLAAKESYEENVQLASTQYPATSQRVPKFGSVEGGECVDLCGYGGENARQMLLLSFIICDGEPARTRREFIMDPRFSVLGIAGGPHPSQFQTMGVIVMATNFSCDLGLLRQSPSFCNNVHVGLRADVKEVAKAFELLKSEEPLHDEDVIDRAAKLRRAARDLSGATGQLLDSKYDKPQ